MENKNSENCHIGIIDLQNILNGIEGAQKRGAFTMEESFKLYPSICAVKKFLNKIIVDTQDVSDATKLNEEEDTSNSKTEVI